VSCSGLIILGADSGASSRRPEKFWLGEVEYFYDEFMSAAEIFFV
jgi:hypothetical protein